MPADSQAVLAALVHLRACRAGCAALIEAGPQNDFDSASFEGR
jgi:hypothetical protein